MAGICDICDKRPQFGHVVSHANNKTPKIFYPNVHKMRYRLRGQTGVKRGGVCTRCLKAGKIEKVI